jgi:hypothetical protein
MRDAKDPLMSSVQHWFHLSFCTPFSALHSSARNHATQFSMFFSSSKKSEERSVVLQCQCFTYQVALLVAHLDQCSICDPPQIFLTSKFSYFLFRNPLHWIERGTANRYKLLIANQPGLIIMIGQSKTGHISHIIFITFFSSRCIALLRFLSV